MKKCVFAGDWVLEKMVGVQRYAYQILLVLDRWIQEGKIDFEVELLVPGNVTWSPDFNRIRVVKKGYIRNKNEKHLWQQVIFPIYVKTTRGIGIDLTAALPVFGCSIYAIHDCIQEAFPENFTDHSLFRQMVIAKRKIITRNEKCRIVTLTHDSKREVQKYYRVPDNRIDIVTCGWEHMKTTVEDDSILNKLELNNGCDFFFSLGSKYKHKNFQWVLSAAKNNPKYKFVITGTSVFSNNENELKMAVPENVIFTGYITNEEIKSLMIHCKALIQPSLYEGFGLPPLEAMSVGAKVIVSNASCLPEIYKNAAYYIDPYNSDCNLDSLMNDKIESAKPILEEYSWEKAAHQLIGVIKKIN